MLKFLDPYLPLIYLALAALALGAILWYGHGQYSKGYAKAALEAAEAVSKERAAEYLRQTKANAEATSTALETITKLELANAALAQLLEENQRAAKADPTADRECLSSGSVRRLNKVR